jgi:type 1 fimbria pilin|tara:strand:+ start:405 stop:875 length:471 start_codon:yes stop_codon:yes gene_type:complete
MLNKFTIIGLIIGSAISLLGVSSMVDSLSNPDEVQEDTQTFGIGEMDKIQFNAPENSSQKITITGDSFDVKISTPNSDNNVDESFEGKANLSWTSVTSGETIIVIQNTGQSEFTEDYRFELERDPLFFTYSILVIIAGIVIIGFSAGFSAKKPKGF